MQVGSRIREIRQSKNVTIMQLAQKANISRVYLSDIERNKKMPSIVTLKKICDVMDLSLSKFYDEENTQVLPPDVDKIVKLGSQLSPRQRRLALEIIEEFLDKNS